MRRQLLQVFSVLLLMLLLLHTARAKRYPCSFADTVNITEGLRLKDGSYSFEGIIIPANLTAEYNIKVIDGIEYGADRHMRGCICLLKACVTFCCPLGMTFDADQQNCTQRAGYSGTSNGPTHGEQLNSIIDTDPRLNNAPPKKYGHIELTRSNGSLQIVSIADAFVIRYDRGCKHKRIERNDIEFLKWDLYANGTLRRDGKLWSTDEYCFTPLQHKKVWSLTPLTCVRHQRGFRVWTYVICVILAVIINAFIATFLVSIPRVRNDSYGESLVFYLLSIVIGYAALAYLALKNPMNLTETTCRSIGFIAYYFIMLSFLLLNFLSWEFWRKLALRPCLNWKRKLIYGLIILLAFALKFGMKYAQDSKMPQHLKPGIGESVCWFDVRLLGIFFFYYLPILLSLGLSIFCCSKAYLAIWNLPENEQDVLTVNISLTKSQFYTFSVYLIGVISITLREIVVWITARLREHFFIIDCWTGICVLELAVTGFVCFLYKNKLVQSWWRKNVNNKSDDFLGVSTQRQKEFDRASNAKTEAEQIALK